MARQKKLAKQCEYLLIGGFDLGYALGVYSPKVPRILLAKGNGYGETIVKTLKTFPATTNYYAVVDEAKKLAGEMKIKVGRDFTADEWLGPEYPNK